MLDVTASIVAYNNPPELINQAISSFLNTELQVRLFISDNSETETLRESLLQDDRITYIFNNANLGFGKGHNVVINGSDLDSKYHIILNPDVAFEDAELLTNMMAYADENTDIGALMPKVVYPDGETQLLAKLLPSPGDLISRRFLPFLSNKDFDLQFTGYDQLMDVPFLSGCFMFVRTELLQQLGGFDERFFMYCEDIDLSRRINQQARTVFYPNVQITHHYAKDSYKSNAQLKIHISSAVKYFNKWGWIMDRERTEVNKKTLLKLRRA